MSSPNKIQMAHLCVPMLGITSLLALSTASVGQTVPIDLSNVEVGSESMPALSNQSVTLDEHPEGSDHRASTEQPPRLQGQDAISTEAIDLLLMPNSTSDATGEMSQSTTESEVSQSVSTTSSRGLSFYLGSRLPVPTALQGPTRSPTTSPSNGRISGINLQGGVVWNLDSAQRINLELRGGSSMLGTDISYTYQRHDLAPGVSINFFNQRSYSASLAGGDRETELPGGDQAWVHRLGGGIELLYPINTEWDTNFGLNFQRVSVRDDVFSSDLFAFDELGNRLTVSNSGQDDLLTLNFAGQYDTRNNVFNPTTGSRARFGIDQSIPVGDEDISFTRFMGTFTQYIPFDLFGFTEGPRTLVFNLQGGHIFDEVTPYEAFNIGGSSSVRGYGKGEAGTSTSYIQSTLEYRFPMFSLNAFDEDIDVSGMLFVDYASTFDTQDEVIGQPGEVRDRPGDGFGYGLGLRAISPFGPVRLEFGLADDGGSEVYFTIGDRF